MLDRNIPAVVAGDVNVFTDRRALDALALLWNVLDPFRHDWLLRTLTNPALGLSDASLAMLCGEPPDPQAPLLELDEEPVPTVRASRWNPKRDLRLGWNVIRGEQDEALGDDAAVRLRRFRALRERWLERHSTMHRSKGSRVPFGERVSRAKETRALHARARSKSRCGACSIASVSSSHKTRTQRSRTFSNMPSDGWRAI